VTSVEVRDSGRADGVQHDVALLDV